MQINITETLFSENDTRFLLFLQQPIRANLAHSIYSAAVILQCRKSILAWLFGFLIRRQQSLRSTSKESTRVLSVKSLACAFDPSIIRQCQRHRHFLVHPAQMVVGITIRYFHRTTAERLPGNDLAKIIRLFFHSAMGTTPT